MTMLLSEQYEVYAQRANLAETSLEIRRRGVRYFIELFGDMDVRQIQFGHVEDLQSWLAKTRSPSTASIYMQNVKPFFGWLVKRGIIDRSPFESLEIIRQEEFRGKPFEPDEIERMVIVAESDLKIIVMMGLLSLRRAEVFNLIRSDIHFDKGYLAITPKTDTASTWRWSIKNHKSALIPLPKQVTLPSLTVNLHEMLRAQIDNLPPKQPYVCLSPKQYQRNVRLKAEGKLTAQLRLNPGGNFPRTFRALQKRAAVSPVRRFHDLRVTFATTMANKGLSIKETQLLMRHSSPSTTMKYYIAVDEIALLNKANEISSKCYAEQAK